VRQGEAEPGAGAGLTGVRAVAVAVVVVGAVALWQSLAIREGGGYSTVGPRFLPVAVSIALVLLGVAWLVASFVRPDAYLLRKVASEQATTHWPTVGLVAVLLGVYAFALEPLGWLPATALFVPVTARVLGSRSLVRDVAVGLVLALLLFFGFTRFLGVQLPGGILEPVLGLAS
jgi:putative tricarboxylic transport membrane protein